MNILKRFSLFEIVLIIVILGIHLYAATSDAYNFPNTWYTRDDAYYYFKVAQNIAEGHGSTFDGINPTNGYHPLWMVICVPVFALARYDLILPLRVLLMVLAVFNAGTGILIYRLIKSNLSHSVALLAASFWSFNLYIHYIAYELGLETAVAAFFIILFLYKLSHFERSWRTNEVTARQLATLALIAVFVLFSRLDLIFLVVVSGIWILFRGKSIRFLLPLDILIVFLSMTLSVALRTGIETYNNLYASSALDATFIALIIKLPSLYLSRSYQDTNPLWKQLTKIILVLIASELAIAITYLMLLKLGVGKNFPGSSFLIDFCISTTLIVGLRLIAHWFSKERTKTITEIPGPVNEFLASWKVWLYEGAIYYGILGGALSLYMLFNKIMFGTFMPVSGQIKRWWGTLGNTVYDNAAPNLTSFLGISFEGVYDAWQPASTFFVWGAKYIKPLYPGSNTLDERYYIVMAVTILILLVIFFFNTSRVKEKMKNLTVIPLIAGSGIQILSYTATAYGGTKEWYWISQIILIVLVSSIFIDLMLEPLQKFLVLQKVFPILSIIVGLWLSLALWNHIQTAMPHHYFPSDRAYMEVLPYLEENTPPGAIIGMTGGGNVAYFIHDRTIVNMDGLINSYAYFKSIQNGTAPIYLQQHGLQIVFANPRLLAQPPYYGQFAAYLQNYSAYGGKSLMYLLPKPKY